MLTSKQREKLMFIQGVLEGLAWGAAEDWMGEALNSIQQDIGKLLEEDLHGQAGV